MYKHNYTDIPGDDEFLLNFALPSSSITQGCMPTSTTLYVAEQLLITLDTRFHRYQGFSSAHTKSQTTQLVLTLT